SALGLGGHEVLIDLAPLSHFVGACAPGVTGLGRCAWSRGRLGPRACWRPTRFRLVRRRRWRRCRRRGLRRGEGRAGLRLGLRSFSLAGCALAARVRARCLARAWIPREAKRAHHWLIWDVAQHPPEVSGSARGAPALGYNLVDAIIHV